MSKAILILDMPKGCGECKLRFYNACYAIAENNYSGRTIVGSRQVRKKWCPLKPLPQKKEAKEIKHFSDFVYVKTEYDLITNNIVGKIKYDVETIFNEGYNSCLDEILGDKK